MGQRQPNIGPAPRVCWGTMPQQINIDWISAPELIATGTTDNHHLSINKWDLMIPDQLTDISRDNFISPYLLEEKMMRQIKGWGWVKWHLPARMTRLILVDQNYTIFTLTTRGPTLVVRIWRREILTSKVDPRTVRVNISIMAVDS